MIQGNYITGDIFIIIPIVTFFYLLIAKNERHRSFISTAALFTFSLYTFIVIKGTLFPIPFDSELIQQQISLGKSYHPFNNFKLFSSIERFIHYSGNSWYTWKQILGNIVLFVPFGFLLPIVFKKTRSLFNIIMLSFLASLFIELSQLFISQSVGYTIRVFDVDDLLLNSIGGVIGYVIFKPFLFIHNVWRKWTHT